MKKIAHLTFVAMFAITVSAASSPAQATETVEVFTVSGSAGFTV